MRSFSTFAILYPNKVIIIIFFCFENKARNINYKYPDPCALLSDLIAIPDFQSGAMENWGLTTYRETSLLYDPLTSSVSDKLWVTMVIGHELAHQVGV